MRMAQVYIHGILQMAVMDKVLFGFIESFIQDRDVDSSSSSSSNREWTDSDGVAALEEMRKFLDHLQGFFLDCFYADCAEIVTHFNQKSRRTRSVCSIRMLSTMAAVSSSPSSPSSPSSSSPSHSRRMTAANPTSSSSSSSSSLDSEVMKFISEDELRSSISSAVRKQIEIEVYLPCSSRLTGLLDKAYFKREKNVRHVISCIVNQPQSFYGIPVGMYSMLCGMSYICIYVCMYEHECMYFIEHRRPARPLVYLCMFICMYVFMYFLLNTDDLTKPFVYVCM